MTTDYANGVTITAKMLFLDVLSGAGLITPVQAYANGLINPNLDPEDIKSVTVTAEQFATMRAAVGPAKFDAKIQYNGNAVTFYDDELGS